MGWTLSFSFSVQLKFIYKPVHREFENAQRDKTKQDLLRPQSVTAAAVALKATDASPQRQRRRARSPRTPKGDDAAKPTPALAAANAPAPGICHAFNKNCKCDFGDKCKYKHTDANGIEGPKP